jgi:transposase
MDNYTIHKSTFFKENFGDNLNILYLPTYSPQLNPIERIFSVWKSYVRRKEHLVEDILAMHICEKANNFKTQDFKGNFEKSLSLLKDCLDKKDL